VVYLRGKVYWYCIKVTRTGADGTRQEYRVRRAAHTSRRREAEDVEREHRRALRLGLTHPLDPWPPAAPPQAPTLKDFSKRFDEYARLHCKDRSARFYRDCLRRALGFHPLAEIPMSEVTGELVGKYVRFRRSLPSGNSVSALNGEMRTLRANIGHAWCGKMLARLTLPPTVHDEAHSRVWQRRFYDLNVWSDKKRLEKLTYMHNNPVKRGLAKGPGDWPWSSWRFYFRGDASLWAMDRIG
jgi:hypothetical protein